MVCPVWQVNRNAEASGFCAWGRLAITPVVIHPQTDLFKWAQEEIISFC